MIFHGLRSGWLVLVTTCLSVSLAAAQWEWRNPLPQGNTLTDIQAFSGDDCYVAGERGTFLATASGGENWKLTPIPKMPDATHMQFLDQANGILVGFKDSVSALLGLNDSVSVLFKTTDGGDHWEEIRSLPDPVKSAFFLRTNVGWAATQTALLFTSDGGATWERVTSPGPVVTRLFFLDTLSGWAIGKDTIYRTTDGGNSWRRARPDSMQGWITSLDKIVFVSPLVGWVTVTTRGPNHLSGHVLKSIDGGETWTEQFAVGEDFVDYRTFSDIEAIDEQTAWAVSPGRVYRTSDGGEKWEEIAAVPHISQISPVHEALLWGCGLYGVLYRSTDGGTTWERKYRGTIGDLNDLQWVDQNRGFAAGDTLILKTQDGGRTWIPHPVAVAGHSFLSIRAVWFVDSLRGWVGLEHVGGIGSLLSTTDGGGTWSIQLDSIIRVSKLFFLGKDYGWAASGNRIYRTTDGGGTWTPGEPSTDPGMIESRFLTSTAAGWAGGYLGLARTTDGGLSWTTVLPGGMAGLFVKDISFVTEQFGWMVGYSGNDGYIFRTEDGGESWSSQPHPTEPLYTWFRGVGFADLHHGWAVGESSSRGFAYRTIDGGVSWEVDEIPLNRPMLRVRPQGRDIWILGQNGALLRTSLNSVDVAEGTPPQGLANAFVLEQNYPNPFNPTTVVSSQLPVASHVKLAVYDLLGREVAVLVNEWRAAGKHQDVFSAAGGSSARGYGSSLASGVYLYRMSAGDFVQTLRMIVLK
jgi:photosystem II stability/assembly factor-like uncharacterized protein